MHWRPFPNEAWHWFFNMHTLGHHWWTPQPRQHTITCWPTQSHTQTHSSHTDMHTHTHTQTHTTSHTHLHKYTHSYTLIHIQTHIASHKYSLPLHTHTHTHIPGEVKGDYFCIGSVITGTFPRDHIISCIPTINMTFTGTVWSKEIAAEQGPVLTFSLQR